MKLTSITRLDYSRLLRIVVSVSEWDYESVQEYRTKTVDDDKYTAFYKKYANGIYTFGLYQNFDGNGHSSGYKWSSNASYINRIFDLDLVEVSVVAPNEVSRLSGAVSASWLKEQLPEGYDLVKGELEDETGYYVVTKDNV